MDCARNQFFSCTGFSKDENRSVGCADLRDLEADVPDRVAITNHLLNGLSKLKIFSLIDTLLL
jgi:hypothetical protein